MKSHYLYLCGELLHLIRFALVFHELCLSSIILVNVLLNSAALYALIYCSCTLMGDLCVLRCVSLHKGTGKK